MVRRELAALRRHECNCVGGGGSGSGSGGSSRRTYDLKIIMIDRGNDVNKDDRYPVYIDKSPETVYAAFAELIKQKYYIKYAEGTTSMHMSDGEDQIRADNIPSIYIGTCIAGTNTGAGAMSPSKPEVYSLTFNFDRFGINVIGSALPDGTIISNVLFMEDGVEIDNGGEVYQYNDEDLGDNYTILDLTFVWESLD